MMENGNKNSLIKKADSLLKFDPKKKKELVIRGLKEIDKGKELSQLKDAEHYLNQGIKYIDSEKYQEAIAAFKKVIMLDPNNGEGYSLLAYAYESLGMYREAIEVCKQEVKIRSDDATAYCGLAYQYCKSGMYKEAIEAYRQAVRIQPYHADYSFIASASSGLGLHREAIKVFRQALRIQPNDADAYYGLAFAYNGLGMKKEAIEAYRQAVKIQPYYTNIYLAFASRELGLHREAIEGYRQAIRIRPDDATAYYGLGIVYSYIGQKGKALEVYEELKKIHPNFSESLLSIYINKIA